jgi:hypothetical protein
MRVGRRAPREDPQDRGWADSARHPQPERMTTTLQMRNTVHDFEAWKATFDKFERFRAEHGVLSYRVLRRADDAQEVQVLLDFESPESAVEFRGHLDKIRETPQSRRELAGYEEPVLLEDVGRESW